MKNENDRKTFNNRQQKSSQKTSYVDPKKKVEKRKSPQEKTNIIENEDFVFGHYAVREALQANRGNKLFIQQDAKGAKIQQLKEETQKFSVPIQWVPKEKLDMLTDHAVHQGVVLGVTAYEYLSLEDLLEQTLTQKKDPIFLLLDGIEDPHNLGSILRTADAVGIDGVIIPKHRAVGVTSVVAKTSTGAVEYIPIARVTNLSQCITKLKEKDFWIFGTDMQGIDYRSWDAKGAVGLIIGNEGRGISSQLKKEADILLTIPMKGHVQSLNAGVAAGLLMYEAFRKRS